MARERQHDALQTIFSFFLGLMVVAFIGVGVNTFYASPSRTLNDDIQELYDKQSRTLEKQAPSGLTPAEQAASEKLAAEIRALEKERQRLENVWMRNTSIVLIVFATVVMAISLVRSEQLKVISNGLLLGGLFTMVYGSGWTIAAGDSVARFIVISFALVVTIALGYLKFVRPRTIGAEPGDPPSDASPVPPVPPGD